MGALVLLALICAASAAPEPVIMAAGGNITVAAGSNGTVSFQTDTSTVSIGELALVSYVNTAVGALTATVQAALGRISTLEHNAMESAALAMGTALGSFSSSYSTSALAAGWRYLWNTASIGIRAQYSPLYYNEVNATWTADPISYPSLSGSSGLVSLGMGSGRAGPTRTQSDGNGLNRYAIASYTAATKGIYFLTNTTITSTSTCGTGLMVRVYVNDNLVKLVGVAALGSATFDAVLGTVNVGDMVYVAVGASADGACTAGFTMDYGLQVFSAANQGAALAAANMVGANSVVATTVRACEPTDVGVVYSTLGQLQVCTSSGWAPYSTAASTTSTLTNYPTNAALATALADYTTTSGLNTLLSGYPTNSALATTLTGYPTNAALATTLSSYTTSMVLASSLAAYTNTSTLTSTLTGYVTTGALTSMLAAYTTSSSLTSTLAGYVTSSALTSTLSAYTTSSVLTSTLAGYVTSSALSSTLAGYTTSSALTSTLSSYVTGTSLGSTLTAYPTTVNLNNILTNYANASFISSTYVSASSFSSTTSSLSQSITSVSSTANQTQSLLTSMRGTVVANYRNDFANPPKAGWSYQWNAAGSPIGARRGYGNLIWAGTLSLNGFTGGYTGLGSSTLPNNNPAQYLCLTPGGGHVGPSVSDGAGFSWFPWTRYAIAGYTVSQAGVYAITGSSIFSTACGGLQLRVRIYVNDLLVRDQLVYRSEGNVSFDTKLGQLQTNSTIYAAVGPGEDGASCDNFNWNYNIVQFPSDQFALSYGNTLSMQRVFSGLITTFAGYRRAFRSPQYLRDGWAYMWNNAGAIGTSTNYANLIWDGTATYAGTSYPYLNLGATGGHPGPGSTQSTGGFVDRFAIAAYTIQYSGLYQITNSYVTRTNGGCAGSVDLGFRVYINNAQVGTQSIVTNAGSLFFNQNLGFLNGGDVVYVAIGPNGNDQCDGFALDYIIRENALQNGLNDGIAGGSSNNAPGSNTPL